MSFKKIYRQFQKKIFSSNKAKQDLLKGFQYKARMKRRKTIKF